MPRKKLERRGEKPKYRSRSKDWAARIWEADGTPSGWQSLGTDNREIAHERYQRWLETGELPITVKGKEKFEPAADRILKAAEKAGDMTPKLAQDRRQRLWQYVMPSLGMIEVSRIRADHVVSIMRDMAKPASAGGHDKSAGSILKVRSDISQILTWLRGEGAISENCARELPLPKGARVDTRERMSLSDEQLLVFQATRGFKEPLDMMILCSRQVAGHRTSDEHAGTWDQVDLVDFAWMKVRRPKTDGEVGARTRFGKRRVRAYEMVSHEIDPEYRPHFRAYWQAQGKPTRGPLFPVLRDGVARPMKLKDGRVVQRQASRVGDHKAPGSSYADVLRRAVWECEIYSPMPVGTLIDKVPTTHAFDPDNPDTGLCFLQTDTDETRRLDFQSFRRDLVTALADAKVPLLDQLAITGHTQVSTQLKHYMKKRRVKVPRGALPGGAVEPSGPTLTPEMRAALEALLGHAQSPSLPESSPARDRIPRVGTERASQGSALSGKYLNHLASPTGIEPVTRALGTHGSALQDSQARVTTKAIPAGSSPDEGVSSHELGGKRAAFFRRMLAEAAADGDLDLLTEITAVAQRRALPLPANVHKLDTTRKRRR